MNAMKYMQLLVRVQSQIQSRRIQMLENQARYQANDKDVASTLGKLTLGHAVSPLTWSMNSSNTFKRNAPLRKLLESSRNVGLVHALKQHLTLVSST